ncbi:unnamed protein product [Adineta ricciae]|uniref:Uncharacterized protein n=1 Tax=Adineta ricciae TaxID=249248 RepID=A0A813TY32_ADIRI|nr:unnamed protein product [Adineta ricciae]CAF1319686.1 unnamed protein product [Adineta ricciae]
MKFRIVFFFIIFLLKITFFSTQVETRSLRKRRGVWPDVLAPGGNTFANRGYYNMHSYIAYPESGIAFNQPWNPYFPNYYPNNQFNPFVPPNQIPPFGNNMVYPGYFPNGRANPMIPPNFINKRSNPIFEN